MSSAPHFNIIPCCPFLGEQIVKFIIPGAPSITNDTYIYNGVLTTINGITFSPGFCYNIVAAGVGFIGFPNAPNFSNFSLVNNCSNQECLPCPELCFLLTNCETGDQITSNTSTLFSYFNNGQIVTLIGYDGCWSIAESEECICPVNVTVLLSYDDCVSCVPVIAYKFTNCDNSAQIQYSTEDYSAYVGQVVNLNCGDCWIVELIDYTPPAVQVITIITNFESCLACNRTYYILNDCLEVIDPIITYTDLSDSLEQIIKIEGCDTCWSIALLEFPTIEQSLNAIAVIITISYVDCEECLIKIPCKCSIAWPNEQGELAYIDCTGETIKLNGLDPNTPSEKLCIRAWTTAREPIYFGDCIEDIQSGFKCPLPILPKRFIKPGYTTPTCDTTKYEKISCNASDILYKMVLTGRYGISNCCESIDDKWLIKKELIDLQAVVDPNYICTPGNSCGCGCNGISTTTCNS